MIYPMTISITGRPKKGKTTFAAKFPNSFIIDFAPVNAGVGKAKILTDRAFGESWFSVREQFKKTYPDTFEAELTKRYRFVKSWEEFENAIEDAKKYKESVTGNVWIVLDDSYRYRMFAVNQWIAMQAGKVRKSSGKQIDWPSEAEWGLVSQLMIDNMIEIHNNFHLVVIHRMKDEYIHNVATGEQVIQGYPAGIHYNCDVTIEICVEKNETTGKSERYYSIIWNRYQDECNEIKKIPGNNLPIEVLAMLGVPSEFI